MLEQLTRDHGDDDGRLAAEGSTPDGVQRRAAGGGTAPGRCGRRPRRVGCVWGAPTPWLAKTCHPLTTPAAGGHEHDEEAIRGQAIYCRNELTKEI